MSIWQKPPLGAQPVIQVPGLVGNWIMNDGGPKLSTIQDYSGNGNTGTLVADAQFTSGFNGPALTFDGSGDYVITTYNTPFGTGEFSLNAWIWADSVQSASFPKWAGMGDTNAGEWMWGPQGDRFNHYFYADSGLVNIEAGALPADAWFMATVVKTASSVTLFINAVAKGADSTISGLDLTDTTFLRFGNADNDANRWFNGKMSNIQIYNRALTPGEVQQLYNDSFYMFRHDPIELWTAASPAAVGGNAPTSHIEGPLYGPLGGPI